MTFAKWVFIFMALFIFVPGTGMAQDQSKTFAVLPITIHGPEKYQYLEQGIASMLTSRLSRGQEFRPVSDDSGLKSWADVSSANQAEQALADIQADALFWGSATISGGEASLDLKALEARGKKSSSYSQTTQVQDIIPALEDIVDSIHSDLFESGVESTTEDQTDEQATKSLNTQFIQQGMTGQEGTGQGGLNPSFEYQTGAGQEQGKWQSQILPFASTGMIVEDADNDGKDEIFIMGEHRVEAYAFKQGRLDRLDSFEVPTRVMLLNINTLDTDRDKLSEIVISGIFTDRPRSYILKFKDGKFKVVHQDVELFFNVKALPPEFTRQLVAQKQGKKKLFTGGVHQAIQVDGEYRLGRKLNLPSEANVFNFTYLPTDDGDFKIIVADRKDRLRVFSKTKEQQYRTEEKFAASGLGLELANVVPGMGESKAADLPKMFYYIPTRLLPCNLDKDEKFELLVNQSLSRAADFFPRYRHFPQGRIYSLSWDGLGLNTEWKTRMLKGTVVDYGIGDPDNDGQKDLYVCVNTHPGALGTGKRKTMILTYDLDMVEEEGK